MELPIRFKNAKVVGENIKTEDYLRQPEPHIKRGHPDFVMSRSELMMFASNAKRWLYGYTFKDTDATEFGSLIDCLLLTPDRFDGQYIVRPETCTATKSMKAVQDGKAREGDQVPWSPLSKECQAWKKDAESRGLIVLSPQESDDASKAVATILADPEAGQFIKDSARQVLVVGEYHDRDTKLVVPVKSLIDLLPRDDTTRFKDDMADFKTARNAEVAEWLKVIPKRSYDCQAAFEIDLHGVATGRPRITFRHIIMENVFPFAIGRRIVGEGFIDMGRIKYLNAFERYCQCLKTGVWPDFDPADPEYAPDGWTLCSPDEYQLRKAYQS